MIDRFRIAEMLAEMLEKREDSEVTLEEFDSTLSLKVGKKRFLIEVKEI